MRLNVTDLVGDPGATRAVERTVDREAFGRAPWGVADEVLRDPLTLALHLDAVVDGILVRGTIGFNVTLACARCLAPLDREIVAEVVELFVDPRKVEPGDEVDEGYEIIDNATAIDLSTLVRDALLIDLPYRVLCRDDCAGLCAICGADLNETDCGHRRTADADPRWAALADLTLPPE